MLLKYYESSPDTRFVFNKVTHTYQRNVLIYIIRINISNVKKKTKEKVSGALSSQSYELKATDGVWCVVSCALMRAVCCRSVQQDRGDVMYDACRVLQVCPAGQRCNVTMSEGAPKTTCVADLTCPLVQCRSLCPHGRVIDKNGCELCACKDACTGVVSADTIQY